MSIDFIRWCFDPKAWVILGILLIIADVFLGYDFFVLPVGIAAFIIAILLYAQQEQYFGDMVILSDWHMIGMSFGALSVICIGIVKFAFQRKKEEETDINDY